MTFDTCLQALTGTEASWELDPAIELHETWEQPAWELAMAMWPSACRWLIPQAPLDTLAGHDGSANWVDFLYCSPWRQVDHVIEIDGSDHNNQRLWDDSRNEILREAGQTVHRIDGPDTVGENSEFGLLLKRLAGQSAENVLNRNPPEDPPWKSAPRSWSERSERRGWDVEYTVLGGCLRSSDPLKELEGEAEEKISRLTTQVFVATTESASTPSSDAEYWATVCQKILQRGDRPAVSPRTQQLLESGFGSPEDPDGVEAVAERLIGPLGVQRFGLALVKAVLGGHLSPNEAWTIRVDDATGLVEPAAGAMLDLLAAIDDVWLTDIVPPEVVVNGTVWQRQGQRFQSSPRPQGNEVDLIVVLDPYTPAHAALSTADTPTVVIRSTYLPIRPKWLASPSNERRDIVLSQRCQNALHVILEDLFGHEDFREGQLGAILRALAGKETAVMLPTGTGKSLIFQMAGLLRPGLTVAVDPLVSLIDDQTRGLRIQGISRVAKLHRKSLQGSAGEELLASVGRGDALFAFLTPERLQTCKFRPQLKTAAKHVLVNLAIVDESHCVSEWGHDFRPAYLNVGRNLRSLCRDENGAPPPLLALTATASPNVRREMFRELDLDASDPEALQTPSSQDRPNLHLSIHRGEPRDRRERLTNILFNLVPEQLGEEPQEVFSSRGSRTSSMIVFVPHRGGQFGFVGIQQFLEDQARRRGLVTGIGYYGGEPRRWTGPPWDDVRRSEAEAFIENRNVVLVATKGFGMGIDKPNIRATCHYGMPGSIEAFAQEYGRAGRDGYPSYCYLSATLPDEELANSLLDTTTDFATRKDRYDRRAKRFGWKDRQRKDPLDLFFQTDIDHQLYFHYGSFPGVEEEAHNAQRLLTELLGESTGTSGNTIGIPRSRWPDSRSGSDSVAKGREKALYRLHLLGLVYDYCIQYPARSGGSDKFKVDLVEFNSSTIDEALRSFGQLLEPGRGDALDAEIANAPGHLVERCQHHLKRLVEMVYRNIETSRIIALNSMRELALSDADSRALAIEIGGYLGAGITASSLDATISALQETVTADAMNTILEVLLVPDTDAEEQLGATAAQLERTPNHPVALLARAATFAQNESGDLGDFNGSVQRAFEHMADYVPDITEAGRIFEAVRGHVVQHSFGDRNWASHLWSAWPDDRVEAIGNLATEIIDTRSWQDGLEREAVLVTRLSVDAANASRYVFATIGRPSDE